MSKRINEPTTSYITCDPSGVGTLFNPLLLIMKQRLRAILSLLIVSGRGGTRGQSPLAPDLSFSLLLLYPWIKLVKLFVIAGSPQGLPIDGSSSLLTVNLGIIQLPALRPLSVSRKDCVSKEDMMTSTIYISRVLSFEGQERIF